jgi:hypothetical protein
MFYFARLCVYFYIVQMPEEELKFCPKCQLSKPLTDFLREEKTNLY